MKIKSVKPVFLKISNRIDFFWVSFSIFIYVLGINIFMICVLTIDDVNNVDSKHNNYFVE